MRASGLSSDEHRLGSPLPVAADERVHHDAAQPCVQVRAGPEPAGSGERLGERLLHEVLRVRGVAGYPERRRVKGRSVLPQYIFGPNLVRGNRHARLRIVTLIMFPPYIVGV